MSTASSESPVDLWFVRTEDVFRPSLLRACTALLTPEEEAKRSAFVFEKHRHEYLVTRALARAVLARYARKTPSALDFIRNEYGRPELTPPGARFNLTNTTKLVVCAVAADREVGVDAEPVDRGDRILDLADTVFTVGERARLAALPMAQRLRRAVELWTLKEAYIKARGMGMSLPVENIELHVDADAIRLSFHAPVSDSTPWVLETREIEGHLVATCIERGGPVRTHHANLDELLG